MYDNRENCVGEYYRGNAYEACGESSVYRTCERVKVYRAYESAKVYRVYKLTRERRCSSEGVEEIARCTLSFA